MAESHSKTTRMMWCSAVLSVGNVNKKTFFLTWSWLTLWIWILQLPEWLRCCQHHREHLKWKLKYRVFHYSCHFLVYSYSRTQKNKSVKTANILLRLIFCLQVFIMSSLGPISKKDSFCHIHAQTVKQMLILCLEIGSMYIIILYCLLYCPHCPLF